MYTLEIFVELNDNVITYHIQLISMSISYFLIINKSVDYLYLITLFYLYAFTRALIPEYYLYVESYHLMI